MNIRQLKYKKNRIAGMNQRNAALAAGYSPSAANKSNRIEASVKGCLQSELEMAGLTDQYQAKRIFKLTNATKHISCNIYVDKDGQMKGADGKTLDFIEVDDPAIQLQALKHVADLKRQISSKVEHSGEITTGSKLIIIQYDKRDSDKASRIPSEISL